MHDLKTFLLLAELARFDFPNRRKEVLSRIVLQQALLSVDWLRVDARCASLAGVCGAERAFLSRNHARSELDALERDGMILLRRSGDALEVSVTDSRFWKCSQLCDRAQWLGRLNALREVNGVEQLKFEPGSFSANEPTIEELIAHGLDGRGQRNTGRKAIDDALTQLPPAASPDMPGQFTKSTVASSHIESQKSDALGVGRKEMEHSDAPRYSHDSQNRNEFPKQELDSCRSVTTRARAPINRLNESTVNRNRIHSRLNVEERRCSQVDESWLMGQLMELLGAMEMNQSGGHWRVDHVRKHPELVEELLGELRYKISTGFIFKTNRAAWLEGSIKKSLTRPKKLKESF